LLVVGDWVLRAVVRDVAAPGCRAALLGPPLRPLVTHLAVDPEGAAGPRWLPSPALDGVLLELSRAHGLEAKGVVVIDERAAGAGGARPRPDAGGEGIAEALARNPALPCWVAAIVSSRAAGAREAHEVPAGAGRLTVHAAWRRAEGSVAVLPLETRVLPLLGDLELLAGGPGAGTPAAVVDPERLLEAAPAALVPPGPSRLAYGPRGGPALTTDPAKAALAGWTPRIADGADPEAIGDALHRALLARGTGVLSPELRARKVLVVGLGSVGSYVAEQLARSGVGGLCLVDPERVEPANLSRTVYVAEDAGRLKTEALARRLLAIAPAAAVEVHARAAEDHAPSELDALVRAADLVVATTDDAAAQRALDRFAYARGRPAIFVGLYEGARGGEVIVTVPERSACFVCATRARHALERRATAVARRTDYGTGRIVAESALGADIQHVASAAVKLALSLLQPGGPPGALAEEAVTAGTTYLTLSTVPRYWFYPEVFAGVPGQGAFQSVWLSPVRVADCAVCGGAESRVEPLEVPLRAPSRDALAALLVDAVHEQAPAGDEG
jgi:molybdopterin/thiamine biosynthesis adenylyltransferase